MAIKRIIYTIIILLIAIESRAETITLPATTGREAIEDQHGTLVFADEHNVKKDIGSAENVIFVSEGAVSMHAWISGIEPDKLDSITVRGLYDKPYRYTRKDVSQGNILTDILVGDKIEIAYYGIQENVTIEQVYTGFQRLPWLDYPKNKVQFIEAAWCEVNAVCNSKADIIKRGVCRMLTGNEVGTGVLINNTSEDLTPYVISSAHTLYRKIKYNTPCKVIFGWETPECTDSERPKETTENMETIALDQIICYSPAYDIVLFTLVNAPTEARKPYWSGWDITGEIDYNEEYICVHHPYGDVKKVSVGTNLVEGDYSALGMKTAEGGTFARNVHYCVRTWVSGVTEPGSSGSGLWNKNNKIIGLLTGGSGSCSNMHNDYFWSLSKAWNIESEGYKTLREVLDPNDTGVTIMTGRDLYSKESSANDIIESGEIAIMRRCGSITLAGDSIREILIYSLDGKLLYKQQYEHQNEVDVNTVPWTNKLLLVTVKFSTDKEKTVKVYAK